MRKILLTLLASLLLITPAYATTLFPTGGGTGSTTLTGILIGNGTAPVNSLIVGSGLTLTGTTLTSTGGSSFSYPFPANATTSALTLGGLTLSNLAGGGTLCLHVNNTGVVSATASDCGSSGGTVTSVTATNPLFSSGGTTPNISTIFGTTTTFGIGVNGFVYTNNSGLPVTAASSSFFGFTPASNATTITVAGTANQITSSAGAQDLSANRTWTLSLPQSLLLPLSFTSTYGTTTFASSTALSTSYASSTNAFFGTLNLPGILNCNTTSALTTTGGVVACGAISGSGGSAFSFTPTTNFGALTNATGTPIWFQAGLQASSTSQFDTINLKNALTTANGGTGISNPGSAGAQVLLEFGGSGGAAAVSPGSQYTVLQSTAGGSGFSVDAVHLDQSAAVTGKLPYLNGGTGTSTAPIGQLLYGGATAYQSVATGTVSNGTGISVTAGQSIIGSGLTITNTGVTSLGNGTGTTCSGTAPGTCNVNTTQNITTLSNLSTAGTLNNTSSGVLYSTATSTITAGSGIAYTGTMGSEIGGVSGTLSVSGLSGTNFSNVSANTVFANATGATAAPTFVATSTFFGSPAPGSILAFLNGAWTGAATTTFSSGLTYANGNVTNTGVTSIVAGTNITISGATGAVTVNCPSCTGGGSSFPFTPFSATAVSTTSGLMIFASSTIGNGTQATGLTVNGGATTTGSMGILNSLVVGTSTGALPNANAGNLFVYNTNTSGASPAVILGGNPGGDTDFHFDRQNNNDATDNDSLQFGTTTTPGSGLFASFSRTGAFALGTTSTTVGASSFTHSISNALTGVGGLLIATWTNVTNAFTILNATGATVFNVDTTSVNPFLGLGTTTPWASLSVVGNGTSPLFAVATTTNNGLPNFEIDANGHEVFSGVAPVCTSNCTFGAGNDNAFRITSGSAVTSITITFAKSWGINAPICQATEGGNTAVPTVIAASSTPTTVILTSAAITTKDVDVLCRGIQ